MKKLSLTTLFLFFYCIGFSQNPARIDSLEHQLANERQDTNRVAIMLKLYRTFLDNSKPDSAQAFAEKALALATKIHYPKGEFEALENLINRHKNKGDTPIALSYGHRALDIAEEVDDPAMKGKIYETFGVTYMLNLKDYPKAKNYLKKSIQEYEICHNLKSLASVEMVLSSAYRRMNQLDSMQIHQQIAFERHPSPNKLNEDGRFPLVTGQNYFELGNYPLALSFLHKAIVVNHKQKSFLQEAESLRGIALVYEKMNLIDSTIYYEKKAIDVAERFDNKQQLISLYNHLAGIYDSINKDTAYQYLKMAWDLNESVNGTQKIIALETTISEEQERQYQAEAERIASQNRIKQYLFLSGLGILLLIAFILYRINQQKRKANLVLENTLSKLKSTQNQLIQSEKLASLGELTAGIAHEIQNPLNFVNNFSEVSAELVQEIKEERQKPKEKQDESLVDEIFNDISQNLEKITLHGKRASSIVKGMLEHSRTSNGVKEPTDINALSDEYMRLAYHGLRAKDKDFNADFELITIDNLPKIEVIPQDIGRVLLNLINNAFWAVNERRKKGESGYEPKVTVSTQLTANSQVLIAIKDNGSGMSEEIKTKIFQPFFTTKPTGQGTGLGLSLAYDIVTKGHGGTLEVNSTEVIGSEFIVTLPFKIIG